MNGKIVDFSKCKECINWEKSESEDPCWECLQHSYRMFSHTPIHFVKREANDQNGRKSRTK